MKFITTVTSRWNAGWVAFGVWLGKIFTRKIYLYLAIFFTLFSIMDAAFLHYTEKMRLSAFDAILHYRIVQPKPAPDIVIIDINEASLAKMGPEFGRWPWPRQVFGEFVEKLKQQQPKAIVFDILFSDADVYNEDSDIYFNDVIAQTDNTFFPMLRLPSSNDKLSKLKASMIPGAKKASEEAEKDATVAMVLPHFPAAIESKRLGMHNIIPDEDGIARHYPLYLDEYGWKLPSLPARIAEVLKWPVPNEKDILLNWRGKPFCYRYESFAEVFFDLTSKNKSRPANEFKDKILIIGSTAPSLFDIKPTPMSQIHQGVEILATAIDNLKSSDYLRFPDARVPYMLLAIFIVWVTAIGFYRAMNPILLDQWFGLSQFFLVAVSYTSINLSNVYINLTGPISVALAFYSIARTYESLTRKCLEQSMVRVSMGLNGERQATLLLIRLDTHGISEAGWERLRVSLLNAGKEKKSIELISIDHKGMWSLFEKTFAVCWIAPIEDTEAKERFSKDADEIIAVLPEMMLKVLPETKGIATWHYHHGRITCGENAEESWRLLLAETLLHWQISRSGKE
jgi:CHASE2 domain-containing sensor protein